MHAFMQNEVTAGTTHKADAFSLCISPRGGLNLYGAAAVERAWGLTHKNAFSNGVIGPEQGGESFWLRTEPTVAALVSVPEPRKSP